MLKIYKTIILCLGLFLTIQAQASLLTNALLHQSNDPVAGNPNGKITVVEFFDYQCSHCVEMQPVIHDIIQANKNVRFVFKEFPIRGPLSEYASLAALAANKQGKYLAFNEALFNMQPLSEEGILSAARAVKLNMNKLKKDMASHEIQTQLKTNHHLAQALRINGTPAFFIGRTQTNNERDLQFFLGSMRQSEMQSAIDRVN